MLNILVLDKTNRDRGKEIAKKFITDEVAIYFYDGEHTYLFDRKTFNHENLPDAINLIVLHNNNEGLWKELQKEADIIVRYTGGDVTEKTDESNGTYWMQRSIVKGTEIDKKDADAITNWTIDKIEKRETSIPHILRAILNSYLIALSILCQGYLAAHGGEGLGEEWKQVWEKLPDDLKDKNNPYRLIEEKRNKTKDKDDFWKNVIRDRKNIEAELDENGKTALKPILDAVYGESSLSVKTVKGAYITLKSILKEKS